MLHIYTIRRRYTNNSRKIRYSKRCLSWFSSQSSHSTHYILTMYSIPSKCDAREVASSNKFEPPYRLQVHIIDNRCRQQLIHAALRQSPANWGDPQSVPQHQTCTQSLLSDSCMFLACRFHQITSADERNQPSSQRLYNALDRRWIYKTRREQ
jgi:hypothetical protein